MSAVKERLRKSGRSLATVKDPFFCMNITCPPDSYDPNIEPAKDDVMFDNVELVLSVVDKLLRSYYPEASTENEGPPTSAQQLPVSQIEHIPQLVQIGRSVYEDPTSKTVEQHTPQPSHDPPRWRSSMYGIDEDDMEFL